MDLNLQVLEGFRLYEGEVPFNEPGFYKAGTKVARISAPGYDYSIVLVARGELLVGRYDDHSIMTKDEMIEEFGNSALSDIPGHRITMADCGEDGGDAEFFRESDTSCYKFEFHKYGKFIDISTEYEETIQEEINQNSFDTYSEFENYFSQEENFRNLYSIIQLLEDEIYE
ncbi:MAG: hypothetical protein ACRC92_27215 [Peptostreptococcaceae bacterium]